MRTLLWMCPAVAVMSLAFWAYSENYETQRALKTLEDLQDEIARERQELAVLSDEWAYLNRPDRLRELVRINYRRLGLQPLRPVQFAEVADIPRPTTLMLEDALVTSSDGAAPDGLVP